MYRADVVVTTRRPRPPSQDRIQMPAPSSSSFIDRVDDADRPIGIVERSRVFDERANFRVVHVFVFRSTGELLVQRLGLERDRHPGLWGSSVAGYLHRGESYLDAAGRRLAEELRLETPLVRHGTTWMRDRGCKKFIHLYLTTADTPEIGEPDHIEALEFRSVEKLRRELELRPEEFTRTFRHLFAFYDAALVGS
jgi:isopentenyl-diphosphate delta-isomerase